MFIDNTICSCWQEQALAQGISLFPFFQNAIFSRATILVASSKNKLKKKKITLSIQFLKYIMILVQHTQLHILGLNSLSQQIPVIIHFFLSLFSLQLHRIMCWFWSKTTPNQESSLAHTYCLLCLYHLCFACGLGTPPGMQGELQSTITRRVLIHFLTWR